MVFSYDVQHHPDRPGQFSYLRALVLIPKIKADFSDIVITEALPKHLLCRIRQLMCFIANPRSVVFLKRAVILQPVKTISQQIIVITDLNEHFMISGTLQILLIPA